MGANCCTDRADSKADPVPSGPSGEGTGGRRASALHQKRASAVMLGEAEGIKNLKLSAVEGFRKKFDGADAEAFGIAPGRAEVIGNHTDYNEGFILACAVDKYVCMAGKRTAGSTGRVTSGSFAGMVTFDTSKRGKQFGEQSWANYVIGVVDELSKKLRKDLGGFDAFVTSDVPPGSGVSSSAALEMATAKLLQVLYPEEMSGLSDMDIIEACKAAENNFVGMGCGILDQFSSGMGQEGKLVFLDCRDLKGYKYAPFQGACFILANTKAKHELVDGQYDKLRAACFESAEAFAKLLTGKKVTHLRDVTVDEFEAHKSKLTEAQARRAKHIVYENKRTEDSFEALLKSDIVALGKAMSGSHDSSRDDFGNSCEELNLMRKLAEPIDGFLGGRLMGGGFGGCTINLVQEDKKDAFMKELKKKYDEASGKDSEMILVMPGIGAFNETV